MKKKSILLAHAVIFILISSCSTYESFDVSVGYSEYLKTPKAIAVQENSTNSSISLTVIAPEKCGCYLEKVNKKKEIENDVAYQCIGFPLKTDDPGKEIKNRVEEDNAKAYVYYIFDSFADVTKICLDKQLKAYFNEVDIEIKSMNESSDLTSSLSYYSKWAKSDDKIMLVRLIAKSSDGNIVEGTGKALNKMGNGHLAWMIPLGIVTFPVGFAIGAIIFDNQFKALMNKTIAEAIDMAAADLSKKFAKELTQNKNQQYELIVFLE